VDKKMNIGEYLKIGLRHRENPFFIKYLWGKKVLDIGCGRGDFIGKDPVNFVGVDIDEKLIRHCRRQGYNAHQMNATQLEFEDNIFDVVHASQLIEHLKPIDAVVFLREATRVLKYGGIIYLTTPGVRNVWNTFSHERPYPPASFKKLLSSETEHYVRNEDIPLGLAFSYGSRYYVGNRLIASIYGAVDILIPPRDPMGWTIILAKNQQ